MSLPTIFDTCRPRADVVGGTIRDDEFMADLSRVVNKTAPADYLDPAAFFAKSYPTRGMKELLKAVCGQRVLRSAFSGHSNDSCQILLINCLPNESRTQALLLLSRAADKPHAYVSKDERVSSKVSFVPAVSMAWPRIFRLKEAYAR